MNLRDKVIFTDRDGTKIEGIIWGRSLEETPLYDIMADKTLYRYVEAQYVEAK